MISKIKVTSIVDIMKTVQKQLWEEKKTGKTEMDTLICEIWKLRILENQLFDVQIGL